jgi:hypothetical protein
VGAHQHGFGTALTQKNSAGAPSAVKYFTKGDFSAHQTREREVEIMGFFDDLTSGISSATSKGKEKLDEANYNSKIEGKKREINKVEQEIGKILYEAYKEGSEFSLVSEHFVKIDDLMKEIGTIEEEKKRNAEKAEEERRRAREARETTQK